MPTLARTHCFYDHEGKEKGNVSRITLDWMINIKENLGFHPSPWLADTEGGK